MPDDGHPGGGGEGGHGTCAKNLRTTEVIISYFSLGVNFRG